MARSVTSAQMLARLEDMTGIKNNRHFTDAFKYGVLSAAVAETWDRIIAAGLGTEYVKTVTFTTTAGTKDYSIATICPDGDFYKIAEVYVDEGSGQLRPVHRINSSEVQAYRAPAQAVPMRLNYIPCAPVWDGTGDTAFDGINGWEELALVIAAQNVKAKVDDDHRYFAKRQRELEARLDTMGNRISAEAPRVVRRRLAASNDRYAPWRNNVSAYNLRGNTLELYYRFGYSQ